MREPVWRKEYETGITAIDDDHKLLFDHLNDLRLAMMGGGSKSELGNVLHNLREYSARHFSTEEQYMREYEYPQYAKHKAAHDAFLVRLAELEEQFSEGVAGTSVDVLNFLRDWIVHHLQEMDQAYASHLQSRMAA